MIEWRTMKRYTSKFNWTLYHLSVVHDYVLKLRLNSDFKVLRLAKLFEDEFFTARSSTKDDEMAASFVQELQEFFVVPKQHQLFERDDSGLKQNELVAALISLLLRLLDRKAGSINPAKDGVDLLEKELRFLLTVLGDKSLICDEENEQVQNLLAEFEAVANEAASLVHSVVFSILADPIFETMDERLGVLLNHMDLLKANIVKISNQQLVMAEANITPNAAAVDSLFIVESLLYDLDDLLNREDDMIADVKDQIKVFHQELKLFESFVKDIKVTRYSEMEELKEPVMRIRDVVYEAEYLINSFLVGDAPLSYFSSRLSHVIHKIKFTKTGIQEIKKNYDIGALKVAKNFSAQISLQNKRSSEVDDTIVGFEDRAVNILDQLEGGKEDLQIVSIVGMPGLGKTTLAKSVYNHPLIQYKFDKCLWCVVSQTYHRRNLLIDILVSLKSEVDKNKIQNMEEWQLVEDIYKCLKGRRYLIVMDDIWSSNAWDDLRRCFPDEGNGSRILLTNRNKDVAPPSSIIYELPSLSDEQCWELLKKKVFQNESCPPHLLETGKRIAANCSGVPLAIVVIAGILSSMDKKRSTWEYVERNLASYLFSDQNNSVMEILELSYKHLPDHLKPCFLYFGVFPEDTEIPVRKLKWLWVAEGFIHNEKEKSAECLAEEYLMELIDKSLVIVAERRSEGGVKTCFIHDLLHDMCLEICQERNFLKLVDINYSICEKQHRLCFHNSVAASQIWVPFSLHIRSLIGSFLNSSVPNMKLLRVLDLRGMGYNGSLCEIKLLVHLKYLAIYYDQLSMDSLAWIDSLVNLEVFVVVVNTDYTVKVKIPSVMVKMMKLRCVKFTYLAYFDEDCSSFYTNNFEFLSCVSVRSFKDEEMLKCSPHLRKLKCECEAFWAEELREYRYLDFGFFDQLESLNVSFSKPTMNNVNKKSKRRRSMKDMCVAPPNFPTNIKKLTLSGLGLPWEKMSMIGGLPNLQILKLGCNAFAGEIWETRDDEFQQLTFLKLQSLDLAQWNVPFSEHFPILRQLVLDHCYYLQEIPSELGEIVTLQLIEVKRPCQMPLMESAQQIEQERRDNGDEELRVIFTNNQRSP